jgi:hypothetical protein
MDILRDSVDSQDIETDSQGMIMPQCATFTTSLIPGYNYHVQGEVTMSLEHINMHLEQIDRS